MITVDGAGASHGLIARLDKLAFAINSAWLAASLIAATLLAWLALLALGGDLGILGPQLLHT